MITYEMIKAVYEMHGLVDITPERTKHPDTRHFLDPRVSDIFGFEGHGKMRVYYVFNPSQGTFRRRREYIYTDSKGKKYRRETFYILNRRTTQVSQWGKYRQMIRETDIVKQMQLASSAIDAYRIARKVSVD